jgi:hypothetical protein
MTSIDCRPSDEFGQFTYLKVVRVCQDHWRLSILTVATPANGTNSRFPSLTRCTSLIYCSEQRTTSVIKSPLRHHRLSRTDAPPITTAFVRCQLPSVVPYPPRVSLVCARSHRRQ